MITPRLRKFRKSASLTQREIARLVGLVTQAGYSHVESGLRQPMLGVALSCCVLFDASLHDLFPVLAESTEREILARVQTLLDELTEDGDREAASAFLIEVVRRLAENSTP
jgi:transcriptional regulator with XRE-family HTH domain